MFGTCLSLCLSWVTLNHVAASTVDSRFAEIGESRLDLDPERALEAIESLRRSQDEFNATDFQALSSIMLDSSIHGIVRVALVRLLCEKARPKQAAEFLQGMQFLANRYASAVDRGLNEGRSYKDNLYLDPALIGEFIERGAPSLKEHLEDPGSLLEFYVTLLERPDIYFGGSLHSTCLEQFADNPAPLAVRQGYMLGLLEKIPGGRGPEAFIPLVTDDVVPRLREIAFDGPVGRYGYNVAAVDLLAEYGDLETARRLIAIVESQGYDRAAAMRPGSHVWKIESHHNPKLLLDHIASGEWIDHATRVWALKRAISLGVEKGKLRTALLEHASRLGSDARLHHAARMLKELAVQYQILNSSEFTVPPEDPLATRIRNATSGNSLKNDGRTSGKD